MNLQQVALLLAGTIGTGVAVIHGVLTQRLMVTPVGALMANDGTAAPIRRLVPPLLQFSTFNWFVGGLVLIAAAFWFDQDARRVTGLLVGSSYLFGAVANLWGVRGVHPGWMLYAVAVALIAYGVR